MNEKLEEFKKIIHDKELFKKAVHLEGKLQNGHPSITFNANFYTQYSNDQNYGVLINQILSEIFNKWIRYCSNNGIISKEDLENSYCDILSAYFRERGVY